jgi:site-specific DNA-cytosine methylase
MRVLLACEESQTVTKEFRALGHEAYSCDVLPTSGKNPEWHIQGDVINYLNDGWDMMIAHPPCTHIAVSGARHFKQKIADGRQQEGIDFFMAMINAPIEKIAVENPIGIMSKNYRTPDQIIQPYFFGDPFQKSTCLWLKNLPLLYHNSEPNLFDDVITHTKDKGEFFEWIDKNGVKKRQPLWYAEAFRKHGADGAMRSRLRSKTFPGIAKAMASQWGVLKTERITT